jgi:N-acetylglutamate synthase-like GNAT family acetyltransferase
MTLTFRVATQNDCEMLADFVNAAYRGPSSSAGWTTESHLLAGLRTDKEMISEMLSRSDSNLLLAFDKDSNLIGSVHLERRSEETCYLGMFTVKPISQTQGIGKSLLARAEQFARDSYKSGTMEMTVITARTELIAWYERRGYRRTGKMVPFPIDPRFGVLKVASLEMEVLDKLLS